jgi:hypothetical protein
MFLESRAPALLGALVTCLIGWPGAAQPATGETRLPPRSGSATVAQPARGPTPRAVQVSGRIIGPERRQLLSASVLMTHPGGGTTIRSDDATILPDGTFTFRNVPPGRYELRARGELEPGGIAHFATFRLLVDGSDIKDIQMPLLEGAIVSGTLAFEAVRTARPGTAGIRVRAPLGDRTSFGDALTGEVRPGGAYAIRGVMAGSHLITVEGLPYPWVVTRVTFRGQDITDAGLDTTAAQRFENVRITVSDAATELSGLVRDPEGQGVAAAMVLVIPLAQQFWRPGSRRFGLLRTDPDGRFRIRGLPAGEYRAVATLGLDERDVFRPGVLEPLSDAALPLRLEPLEQRVLALPLLPAAGTRRAPIR